MIIDVHCHVYQLTPDEIKNELPTRDVVGVAQDFQSGEELLGLRKQYPRLKVCLGIHPEYPGSFYEYELVEKQIRDNQDVIAGIGEIGLPYFNIRYMEPSEKIITEKKAEELFEKFLCLADELNLPVNLHCVEDTVPRGIDLLKKHHIKKALFHWFEGDAKSLTHVKENGWNISVSPDIMGNAGYRKYIETIAPDIRDILTLESDGPWEYEGQRGLPSAAENTAAVLAEILKTTRQEIITIANRNAGILFSRADTVSF